MSTAGQHIDGEHPEIGWPRAIVTGIVILVVGVGLTVVAANEIILRVTSISRDSVAYLASAVFLFFVVVLAFVLRRLQRRGLI